MVYAFISNCPKPYLMILRELWVSLKGAGLSCLMSYNLLLVLNLKAVVLKSGLEILSIVLDS